MSYCSGCADYEAQIKVLNERIHQQNSSLCLAQEIAAKNERLTDELAELKAILSDSKSVHLNILRGTIQLTKEQALHIAGADGLKERITELEKDSARLDWIEAHNPNLCYICEFNGPFLENMTGTHALVEHAQGESTGATMREAIDSAMQANKEGGK